MIKKRYLRFVIAILGDSAPNQSDLNARVVSMAFRDAGFEVIYLGIDNSPDEIIKAAIQEDADGIYLSMGNKSNLELIDETIRFAKTTEFFDSPKRHIFAGGFKTTPEKITELKEKGISEVFKKGLKTHKIVKNILELYEYN
ncbi:MAG: methylmalonyl-CoA mutase [Candidatus Lokiarchaeota archaeon]|nr:methylmalonyl-CoA mutase [Candidatus Lokiarchaeota archaeon]